LLAFLNAMLVKLGCAEGQAQDMSMLAGL